MFKRTKLCKFVQGVMIQTLIRWSYEPTSWAQYIIYTASTLKIKSRPSSNSQLAPRCNPANPNHHSETAIMHDDTTIPKAYHGPAGAEGVAATRVADRWCSVGIEVVADPSIHSSWSISRGLCRSKPVSSNPNTAAGTSKGGTLLCI